MLLEGVSEEFTHASSGCGHVGGGFAGATRRPCCAWWRELRWPCRWGGGAAGPFWAVVVPALMQAALHGVVEAMIVPLLLVWFAAVDVRSGLAPTLGQRCRGIRLWAKALFFDGGRCR
jgi:hypothetical protein